MRLYIYLRARRGFTLTELIIVIAILAILAGILVPLMVGYIGDTQSSVCNTNRGVLSRSLQAQFTLRTAKGQTTDTASLAQACKRTFPNAVFDGNRVSGICPGGGVYTVTVSDTGTADVTCDKHSDGSGAPAYTPQQVSDALAQAIASAKYNGNVYSPAYEAGKYTRANFDKMIVDKLELPAGVAESLAGKTWAYFKSGGALVVYDGSLSAADRDKGINVTVYKGDTVTETVRHAGTATVGGTTYYIPRYDW